MGPWVGAGGGVGSLGGEGARAGSTLPPFISGCSGGSCEAKHKFNQQHAKTNSKQKQSQNCVKHLGECAIVKIHLTGSHH